MKKTKITKASLKEIEVPKEFTVALKQNKVALENFNSMPPSHKKEYVKWIEEAKKEETRSGRIAKAIKKLIALQKPNNLSN